MNKKLLFFLSSTMFVCYGAEQYRHGIRENLYNVVDVCTAQNKRPYQEDRTSGALYNKGYLFGVLDGHDSDHVAVHVAEQFPYAFAYYLAKSLPEKRAFEESFSLMEEYATQTYKGGSTAVFVYVKAGKVHVAHIGDSRVVCGNKNSIMFATQDQTLAREDERERVLQAGGILFRDRKRDGQALGPWRINCLGMSRSIGDGWSKGKFPKLGGRIAPAMRLRQSGDSKVEIYVEQWPNIMQENTWKILPQIGQVIAEPEYAEHQLTDAHQWLILATDGLWDVVDNHEALMMAQEYYDTHGLRGIARFLCDHAIARESADNITVMVVDLLNLPQQQP